MTRRMALAALCLTLGTGTALARDNLYIVGSSTVYPFSKHVAEVFGEYGLFPPPVVESTGTGAGIRSFCAGLGEAHPDITGASRAMTLAEWDACRTNGVRSVTEMLIGYDGLTIATSRESAPVALTTEDLYAALAANVPKDGALVANPAKHWSDIRADLPEAPIRVVGPPTTSGTRDAFAELAMLRGCDRHARKIGFTFAEADRIAACTTMREDGSYIEAGEDDELLVAEIEGTPGTYGILGYSYVVEHRDSVLALPIEGVMPDVETIAAGTYPLSRPLFLYIKNEHRSLVPWINEFILEFGDGMETYGYLLDDGLVPIYDDRVRKRSENEALLGVPMQEPGH